MTAVPTDDRGLLLGDGLFETILFKQGRAVLWEEHLARLARGCGVLGLPSPDADGLHGAAARAVREAGLGAARAAVRLTWSAGGGGRGLDRPASPSPRLIASAAAAARPTTPAALIVSSVRRNAFSPTSRLKTLSYLDNVLARREALAVGADEAVMLDGEGRLACASAANLFWITNDRLHTPSLACGVLDGVLRAQVLAAADALGSSVHEVEVPPSALHPAQALFITNSLIGLRPVARLDGRAFAGHALIDALQTALIDLM
jgi:branched-chain amino acid aminotransferase/4-amino-4-deoxychorismate lyase